MPSLKEVKNRITSVVSTQQITKAMKMVAAAKLRKAQDGIIQMRPYATKLSEILTNISSSLDSGADNQYAESREVNKVLIVVISSDRGLCGGFNSNVTKAANRILEDKYKSQYEAGNVSVLPIGKKAGEYFAKKPKLTMVNDFVGTFGKLSFAEVRKAAEYAMNSFTAKEYDRVEIIYNEFKNVATQIVKTDQFLPILPVVSESKSTNNTDYIFEPTKEYIVQELIPQSLKINFYKAILESNASEHGARMTAMDKATENAGELLKELRLTYNRSRQAAITKEILEIVGGAEALSAK
jgi:F-type H+-transporting ATPase subunit gamma